MHIRASLLISFTIAVACSAAPADSPLPQTATAAVQMVNRYAVTPNIVYLTANNFEAKLDVYRRRDAQDPQPTLIFIHGGGWTGGSKEGSLMALMPWFELGWDVVNVEYRLARVSLAPAAVEDCLCALRWVAANAKQYGFDTSRLVVTGESAGGHLALTTGMITEAAGLDRECPGVPLPKVAAIVNWYGITDVADLLDGPNRKTYAVTWLSSMRIDRRLRAAYVILSYTHALRLQEALAKANVVHKLVTVPGGKHGGFTPDERVKIFGEIQAFLRQNGVLK